MRQLPPSTLVPVIGVLALCRFAITSDVAGPWEHISPTELQSIAKRTPKLIFFKFHQVGGTTVAETLMRGYNALGKKICCHPGCDLCASHDSLSLCVDRPCLGPGEIRKASLLREPVDKAIANFYWMHSNNDTRLRKKTNRDRKLLDIWRTPPARMTLEDFREIWRGELEYARTLTMPGAGHRRARKTRAVMDGLLQKYHGLGSQEARIAMADARLATWDVVGSTEAFDDFMTLLVELLRWPPQTLTYKKAKVITNRPRVSDFNDAFLSELRASEDDDRLVYGRSVLLADALQRATPNWDQKRKVYSSLQARVNQSCTGEKHKFLIGKDCYQL